MTPRFPWFLTNVFIMTRNAFPQNFSFLAHFLSKLQHLKKCFNLRSNCGFYDQCILKWHSNVMLACYWQFALYLTVLLWVTFCKTDTPEIHDPPRFPWFLTHVFIMTRNAFPQNFSFLAHFLSKLQHLKKCFNLRSNCGFYDQCILKWHSNVMLACYWQFALWAC